MLSIITVCTCAYIFGVLISSCVSFSYLLMFALCMLAAFFTACAVLRKFNLLIPLAIVFMSLGGLRCYQSLANRLYYEFPDKYVTVAGTVYSTPSHSSGTYKYRYVVSADSIEYLGNTYKIRSMILINSKDNLAFGDCVRLSGFLREIAGRENEFEYDYSRYYKSLGIYNHITALELVKTGETTSFMPSFVAGRLKSRMFEYITNNYDEERAAILYAVLLNDKSYFSSGYKTLLIRTGVFHTLYSPYLHMAVLFAIAGFLGKGSRRSSDRAAFFLIVLYALLNSGSMTIVKTAALAAFILIQRIFRGYSDRLVSLLLILLIMTGADPLLCFNSGFMYSVICTVFVYFFYPTVYEHILPIMHKLKIKSHMPAHLITLWFILCVGTLPFSAYYFNGVSVYGILLTPITAPFMFIIYTLSPLGLLPNAAAPEGPISAALGFINYIPHLIEKLPFHYIMLRTPEILEIIIFCLAWILFILFLRKKHKTQAAALIAAAMCAFIICDISDAGFNSLNIYFVNVGQGDGAVLHTGIGETVLIDGGGSADYQQDYNIGERIYLPYLISHGFTNIDTAIVSHYHKDHAEGIIAACENLRVNTLIMPDTMPDNIYRKKLEEIAERRNIKIEYLMQSDEIRFRSGLTLKILAPDYAQLTGTDQNDTSLVIDVSFGKFNALFTGDSADSADSTYPEVTDILKIPHHGSLTASSPEYVRRIKPKYAVVSAGKNNTYNLPNRSVLRRYEDAGSHIMRTDRLGDIRFKVRKNGDIKYTTLISE